MPLPESRRSVGNRHFNKQIVSNTYIYFMPETFQFLLTIMMRFTIQSKIFTATFYVTSYNKSNIFNNFILITLINVKP